MLVVLTAAALRFYGLNWDGGIGAHPDERAIVEAAGGLSFPDGLNPFDVAPLLAYGHLPVYAVALAGALIPEFDPLLMGRVLAASCDVGTVVVTFWLGQRLYGGRVGLLAAAVVALMVGHVQQAHFYTVDGPLAFFALATLLFAVRYAQEGRAADAWLAGGAAGLALSTKAGAALLLVPLLIACWGSRTRPGAAVYRCGVAAGAAFMVSSPFALVEVRTFLGNLATQAAIVRGTLDVPYTRQYRGTWPLAYAVVQELRWGMGWVMGTTAFVGLAHQVARTVRHPSARATWIPLVWVVVHFSFFGALYAKFPRYLLPILPVLAIYGAWLITVVGEEERAPAVMLRCLLLVSLVLRAVAFAAMYQVPHPWVAASAWLQEHAEPGAIIAVEAWDHPLPVRGRDYAFIELPVFEGDTAEKWEAMDMALQRADFVVIASRRGYASVARWPERYDRTMRYYRRLFEGALGFEPVACFGRHPRLGQLGFADDPTAGLSFSLPEMCWPETGAVVRLGRLDESFVVYDHPRVVVFEGGR